MEEKGPTQDVVNRDALYAVDGLKCFLVFVGCQEVLYDLNEKQNFEQFYNKSGSFEPLKAERNTING